MTPGQVNFEAYCKKVNGIAFNGQPIPVWNNLPANVRAAWEAGADAVVGDITQRLNEALDKWAHRTLPRNFLRK